MPFRKRLTCIRMYLYEQGRNLACRRQELGFSLRQTHDSPATVGPISGLLTLCPGLSNLVARQSPKANLTSLKLLEGLDMNFLLSTTNRK